MVKGVPTARSQSYKANQKLQEKKFPTPTTSGNDVLPSPIIIPAKPATQAKGAQLAFTTVCVLQQSLLHAMSPGNNIYDMLQLMGPYLCDCSQSYDEEQARNTMLQQQLDAVNSKLLDQSSIHNAEIFALQGLLAKSQEAQEFYRRQALQADMVPPRRRHRFVSSEADNALTPEQLYQQLLLARDDIQFRDRALARLQIQQTELKSSIEHLLTSSSATIALHVTLLEQHLELRARHQECASSLIHVQTQFSEYSARLQQELQETRHKYDKLADKVTTEDQIFRNVIDYRVSTGYSNHKCRLPFVDLILDSRPHLCPSDLHRSNY